MEKPTLAQRLTPPRKVREICGLVYLRCVRADEIDGAIAAPEPYSAVYPPSAIKHVRVRKKASSEARKASAAGFDGTEDERSRIIDQGIYRS